MIFNEKDSIIDEIMNLPSINYALNDESISDNKILEMMKDQALSNLKTIKVSGEEEVVLKEETSAEKSSREQTTMANKLKREESKKNKSIFFSKPSSGSSTPSESLPVEDFEPKLNDVCAQPSTELTDFIGTANDIQQNIINSVDTNIDSEKVEYIVNEGLKTIIKSLVSNISNAISDKVITTYTDKFINARVVKLQILFSILSYQGEDDEDDMEDNTLYIAKKLFTDALSIKRSNKDDGTSNKDKKFMDILKELLVKAIAERSGGGYIGQAVSAVNSLSKIEVTGGKKTKKRLRRRKSKSKRVIKKSKKRTIRYTSTRK